MQTNSKKTIFTLFALTAGMTFLPDLLQAAGLDAAAIADATKSASDTIEIMAKAATTATDTANASGTPMLEQLLGSSGMFLVTTLGVGGIAGWAVGYTLKKVAKIVAIILGISVISLQYLAYKNWITIDWTKVQNSVDKQALENGAQGLMSILTYNLPFAGTFLIGFFIGFKKG